MLTLKKLASNDLLEMTFERVFESAVHFRMQIYVLFFFPSTLSSDYAWVIVYY